MTKGVKVGLTEDEIQQTVINWSKRQMYKGRPLFDFIHHSPNGGRRATKVSSSGKRYSPEAAKLKRMGTKAGYPDLIIDIPRGPYHGLRLELKKDKRSYPTKEQKEYIELLNSQGYLALVTKGLDETIKAIQDYIELGEFENWVSLEVERFSFVRD